MRVPEPPRLSDSRAQALRICASKRVLGGDEDRG